MGTKIEGEIAEPGTLWAAFEEVARAARVVKAIAVTSKEPLQVGDVRVHRFDGEVAARFDARRPGAAPLRYVVAPAKLPLGAALALGLAMAIRADAVDNGTIIAAAVDGVTDETIGLVFDGERMIEMLRVEIPETQTDPVPIGAPMAGGPLPRA